MEASDADPIRAAEDAFVRTLGAADGQPEASFRALGALTDTLVGARLFTLTAIDEANGVARRLHSSHPDAYPVSGTKPIEPNAWTARVLERRETFVANDLDAIARVFGDHALIGELGCASVVNVPCVVAGRVLGTVNALHVAGHYDAARVARASALAPPGSLCFLLAAIVRDGIPRRDPDTSSRR